jgi:ADP-ribose pyrophosphatase
LSATDKPEGEKLGWKLLDSGRPYSNPWISLRSDRLEVRGRGRVDYTYVQHPGGILVVPVTTQGQILLIRQYRYPVDAWCLEVPAGGRHEDSDPEATARRELLEETGATCGRLQKVSQFFVSNSLLDEICQVFLAWDCVLGAKQGLERGEFIELQPLPIAEAMALARTGGVQDGKSALALLMCESHLREKR